MLISNKYPDRQDIDKVIEETGCDSWIAKKALVSSEFRVEDAVKLVRERLSYQAQSCPVCGETMASRWAFCPYCGERKKGGKDELQWRGPQKEV